MIAFSCSHCGMKLKVKPEFAGRSSRCPTCKQPLEVPIVDQTQAFVPDGHLDGPVSSLAQAKVEGGVTLEPANARPGQKSVRELLGRRAPNGGRYIVEAEIARGGMGAILRAVDCDIRREVAVKYMLDQADPKKKLRFIEEAQITGQLEHPNIVPIHEIGMDAQQRPFFAMKMVQGRSLKDILDDLRGERGVSTPRSEKDYSLGRLLNIFVNACNALAYANSRGVVHRDLKPANIMTGDFGEVYVMDWGLAKVVRRDEPILRVASIVAAPVAGAPMALPLSGSDRRSKVDTSREPDADLTQEGTIMGTPVYMPPEQATGQVQAIDQRSDVYSLGAILYELLTLQPPIDKEGGYLSILMRVAEGRIMPPEQREPKRAMAGKVPRELAAIAMKALAKKPEDRYPTVEALRRDIERFQEGRSVSAKHDTKREMLWKFVKRNKGFSAGAALAFVVLLASLGFLFQAWQETRSAHAKYLREQEERTRLGKGSVPAFLRAARLLLTEKQFADALAQVDVAVSFTSSDADARLLRGQLLIGEQRYEEARKELAACLALRPTEEKAKKLAELCRGARPDHRGQLLALADELARQKSFTLCVRVTQQAETLQGSREELLVHYRKRIDAAWPGLGNALQVHNLGLALNLDDQGEKVKDLTPLQGMKLTRLRLRDCVQVHDLTPLQGMPLTLLNLDRCDKVGDLTPLQGMPLETLNLSRCKQVQDLRPLQGMKLTSLNLYGCGQVPDLMPLKGMPLTTLNLFGCNQVRVLTSLKGMPLTTLDLGGAVLVRDLSPLQGMPLTKLYLSSSGQVQDLTPLKGLRLTDLSLYGFSHLNDLTPLKGLPLTRLSLAYGVLVRDLTPLKGMPLTALILHDCSSVQDLSPLQGMKLTTLEFSNSRVEDLAPLKGMPLTMLNLNGCSRVRDLGALQGIPLSTLNLSNCAQVRDLTPLQKMNLTSVVCTPKLIIKGMDVLRRMKSLKTIASGNEKSDTYNPEVFWKKYDAGEFKK